MAGRLIDRGEPFSLTSLSSSDSRTLGSGSTESQGEAEARSYLTRISLSSSATLFRSDTSSRRVRYPRPSAKITTLGSMTHGPLQWHVIVLPGVDTLPLAAWENLAQFVRAGGVVVALGALPANSESEFPSPQVLAFSRDLVTCWCSPCRESSPSRSTTHLRPGLRAVPRNQKRELQ